MWKCRYWCCIIQINRFSLQLSTVPPPPKKKKKKKKKKYIYIYIYKYMLAGHLPFRSLNVVIQFITRQCQFIFFIHCIHLFSHYRSTDPHITTHPTLITLAWIHNHCISTSSALKHRDVNPDTSRKLQELFEHGHSPSSALNILEMEFQTEDPDKFITQSADRACLPDAQFCYRLVH